MTNKEILQEIREEQKRMAKEFMDLAMKQSIFMNKQEDFNKRVSHILDEKVEDLGDRVTKLETTNKVTAGKIAVGFFLITTLGGFIVKLLGIFDK